MSKVKLQKPQMASVMFTDVAIGDISDIRLYPSCITLHTVQGQEFDFSEAPRDLIKMPLADDEKKIVDVRIPSQTLRDQFNALADAIRSEGHHVTLLPDRWCEQMFATNKAQAHGDYNPEVLVNESNIGALVHDQQTYEYFSLYMRGGYLLQTNVRDAAMDALLSRLDARASDETALLKYTSGQKNGNFGSVTAYIDPDAVKTVHLQCYVDIPMGIASNPDAKTSEVDFLIGMPGEHQLREHGYQYTTGNSFRMYPVPPNEESNKIRDGVERHVWERTQMVENARALRDKLISIRPHITEAPLP